MRASDVPVLALHEDQGAAEASVVAEAERADQEDGVDAVILGCAGMVNVAAAVTRSVRAHVIDPTATAAACMAWLASPGGVSAGRQ